MPKKISTYRAIIHQLQNIIISDFRFNKTDTILNIFVSTVIELE